LRQLPLIGFAVECRASFLEALRRGAADSLFIRPGSPTLFSN
jgi:hypothetical protein